MSVWGAEQAGPTNMTAVNDEVVTIKLSDKKDPQRTKKKWRKQKFTCISIHLFTIKVSSDMV